MFEVLSKIAVIEGINLAFGFVYLFILAPIMHKIESTRYTPFEVAFALTCGYVVLTVALLVCILTLVKKIRAKYIDISDNFEEYIKLIASFLDNLYRLK